MDNIKAEIQRRYEAAKGAEKAIYGEVLNMFPDGDLVPVVRCKDCTFYSNGPCIQHSEDAACGYAVFMANNDFCSYGEKKDGG